MFKRTKKLIATFANTVGAELAGLLCLGLIAGNLYWAYLSFKLGSFIMFFMWLAEICWPLTVSVGLYSLIWDTPAWLVNLVS